MRMSGGDQLERKAGLDQQSLAGVDDQKKQIGIGDLEGVEEDRAWRVSEVMALIGDLVCADGKVGVHVNSVVKLAGVHEIFHQNVHENVHEILMSDEIDPKGLPKSRSKRTDNC